ncbi:calmodulin-binding receptor-like cytoplasmic kinase 1 isoform X2 [Diospyros lotus]|uniref:calmodulin-binding receptor-like cytoplasmic kinase 1 isoform X2 n=1 Tax=Diospyros lotus TaxID=55363 RepID=UPI00225B3C5D|nr:calmodulin-binding receptor-like cytoplasmic kinase 1 isoform X2 [Diospyros lotus]
MRNTSTSPISHFKQDNNFQGNPTSNSTGKTHHRKSQSGFSYIKVAARKVFSVFLFWQRKPSPKTPKELPSPIDDSTGSSNKSQFGFKNSNFNGSSKTSGQVGGAAFSIGEIYKATNNFSPANKLGQGGFGTVYKGKLKDGSLVAIKRAKKVQTDNNLFAEFKNEVLTLSKIEHLNLVRLLGYMEHGDERIIVVEYVSNGTLREHLDGIRGIELGIAERLDIAIDVAHAVTYLHTYAEKLRAKVADFGFARLAADDPGATHISTQVKGTAGYLDPEYLKTYQLTDKSDVYSFGVLLVELVTARYPLEPTKPIKERVTVRWAMQKLKEGEAVVTMDPRMQRNPASVRGVEKILKLAQQCLAPQRQSRPSMKQCCEVLWGIRKEVRENLSHTAITSYHSEKIHVRANRADMYDIIEGSEEYRFRSA